MEKMNSSANNGSLLHGPWPMRADMPVSNGAARIVNSSITDLVSVNLAVQEVCHRITNQFATLNSNLRLHAREIARQPAEPDRIQILLLLDTIGAHIDALAKAHRVLAINGESESSEIGRALHECLTPFKSEVYGHICFTEAFEADCVDRPERLLAISQIVVEVVTNAIKYVRANPLELSISCRKTSGGTIFVEVIDNGPGFPPGFDFVNGGGLGFRLLRMLSRSLGAHFNFAFTGEGLQFQLVVPAQHSVTRK
jgi:two-component sensor histidine kinase